MPSCRLTMYLKKYLNPKTNSMLRSIVLATSIILASVNTFALELTPAQALNRALNGQDTPKSLVVSGKKVTPSLTHTVKSAEQNTVYIFDRNNNGGFMIISANDCASPLLGYTDSGSFDTSDIPEGLQFLLDQYSEEITLASAENSAAPRSVAATENNSTSQYTRMEIAPLITTKWYQTAPYNDLCPVINGTRTPTGCVTTAVTQVMNYYKYPARGTGSIAYKSKNVTDSIKANFAESTYDWDNMPQSIAYLTPESRAAVAKINFDCGAAVKSTYNIGITSSNFQYAGQALVTNFGYDCGIRLLYHKSFTEKEWADIIYNELINKRPVLYGASSESGGGHAFICDGYAAGEYFHINWGWAGQSDGYFRLTALDPSNQGVGGTGSAYTVNPHILVGVCPAKEGSKIGLNYELGSNMQVAKTQYVRSASTAIKISTTVLCKTFTRCTVTFGIKLTAVDGSVTYLAANTTRTPFMGSAYNSVEIPSTDFPQEGTYTVTMAVRNPDGEWETDCFSTPLNYQKSITLIANDNILDFVNGSGSRVTLDEIHIDGSTSNGKVLKIGQ